MAICADKKKGKDEEGRGRGGGDTMGMLSSVTERVILRVWNKLISNHCSV